MLISLLLAVLAWPADTVRLVERTCTGCRIVMDTVVSFGEKEGPGELAWQFHVTRDARGRYWVVTRLAASEARIFSADGRYLRSVGGRGAGPGEFSRIARIAPFPGGMLLTDDIARRGTLYDLDFRLLHSRPAFGYPDAQLLRAGAAGLVAAIVKSPDRIGYSVHEIDTAGTIVRSLVLNALPYREDMADLFKRHVSASSDVSRYWISHRREYAFAHCRFADDACEVFLRPVSWFRAPVAADFGKRNAALTEPPPPQLVAVSQDDPRFLWTLSWVPDSRWRGAVVPTASSWRITDLNRYFDSVIERVDLVTHRVVASQRVDQVLWSFVAPGQAWFFEEDPDGHARAIVARFTAIVP